MLAQWFVTPCTGPVIAAAIVTGFNNGLNTVNKKITTASTILFANFWSATVACSEHSSLKNRGKEIVFTGEKAAGHHE